MPMDTSRDGGWRYQAVYVENKDNACEYSVCEVYLDANGRLEAWTESRRIAPLGETLDELLGDIRCMTEDISKWKPVPYNALRAGMTFEHSDTE